MVGPSDETHKPAAAVVSCLVDCSGSSAAFAYCGLAVESAAVAVGYSVEHERTGPRVAGLGGELKCHVVVIAVVSVTVVVLHAGLEGPPLTGPPYFLLMVIKVLFIFWLFSSGNFVSEVLTFFISYFDVGSKFSLMTNLNGLVLTC